MPAIADSGAAQVMEITEAAWVRATPPNRDITAGYLTIRNTGSETRHIVAAASPVAGRVELHTHIHDRESGMMQMREVESIELPAGETVQLAPGGLHLMIMNLKQDLQPGASVSLTLEFDDGSHLELEAEVHRQAPGGHQGHGHGHHHH
ncbi:hypothetical protein B1C78_03170 [Thioalkalivibrio denitrificans]|uniref:Copper chaperone PCu(A)C n=2 Tax=Thioalkalivibrio denitrificans TaxID=108003 RepID=A0A1V3NRT7_9GAMM|nr:hypothetical protein B1C78_03170 [Thioalkalivibrio denitrificans]